MTSIFLPVSTGMRILEPQVLLAFGQALRAPRPRQRASEREQRAARSGASMRDSVVHHAMLHAMTRVQLPANVSVRSMTSLGSATRREFRPVDVAQNLITATSKPRFASSLFIRLSSSVLS